MAHHHEHNLTPYAATAAPPPTPSIASTATETPDALSFLLRHLPPTLSLRRPSSTTVTPTTVNLSDPDTSPMISAATQTGFFQILLGNLVSNSAPENVYGELFITANTLFNLPDSVKHTIVTKNWPIGYESSGEHNDDDDDANHIANESFCFELDHHSTLTDDELGLNLSSLHDLGSELKKTGLEVIDKLGDASGFKNPALDDPSKLSYQLWVSNGLSNPGLVYPYAIGLHCAVRPCEKYSLLTDSGWAQACGLQAGSVLVTLGDIAQVWSNGKFKKVRGRAVPCMSSDTKNNYSSSITMSLLITLPLESIVSPLVPNVVIDDGEEDGISMKNDLEKCQFRPFSFEDYAWRVYHERILTKDPLVRYRV